MDDFKGLFLKESRQQIKVIEESLPSLKEGDKKSLEGVFRAFHSIKGMAASMGYDDISTYAHLLEELLSRLRKGTIKPAREVIDLIRTGKDAIDGALVAVEEGRESGLDAESLKEAITSIKDGGPVSSRGNAPATVLRIPKEVTVAVHTLEYIEGLVGELLTSQRRIRGMVKGYNSYNLDEEFHHAEGVLKTLYNLILEIRLFPFKGLTYGLRRLVEDSGKEIDFSIEGEEVELDRLILERLLDPLVHIVRNAIDHGIEEREERLRAGKPPKGLITIRVKKEAGELRIEVCDDGRGIDLEDVRKKAMNLGILSEEESIRIDQERLYQILFEPGFTTSERVTEVSGRGVGMDVVRKAVEDLGGRVTIDSRKGEGTRITLTLPARGAIMRILLIGRGEGVFGIPLARVERVVEMDAPLVREGKELTAFLDGNRVNVFDTGSISLPPSSSGSPFLVLCRKGGDMMGFLADRIIGEVDGYLRDLPPLVRGLKGILGYTYLEEERPVFIIEPNAFLPG